jgi:hypothetical protein
MSDPFDGKKLFVCRTEIVYYALAEDAFEARDHLQDALRDGYYYQAEDATAIVKARDCIYDGDWDKDSEVYGDDTDDMTLGECFDAIKAAEKEAAAKAEATARQGGLFQEDKANQHKAAFEVTKGHNRIECCCVDCCWLRQNPKTLT